MIIKAQGPPRSAQDLTWAHTCLISPTFNPSRYDYSRSGNPTREALEVSVASLEKARHGLAFASGLAATATFLQTLAPGDRVVVSDDVYGGTNRIFSRVSAVTQGVHFVFVDMTNLAATQAAISAGKTAAVWIESPTNPTLKIADIRAVAAMASAAGQRSVLCDQKSRAHHHLHYLLPTFPSLRFCSALSFCGFRRHYSRRQVRRVAMLLLYRLFLARLSNSLLDSVTLPPPLLPAPSPPHSSSPRSPWGPPWSFTRQQSTSAATPTS